MAAEITEQSVKVFYCYAREDKDLRDQLDAHLTPLRLAGRITTWSDRQIAPGTNWQEAIDRNLETANLILILVSAQCIASGYCWGKEIKRALERHKAGEAHVIPIILRPIMWKETPLGELQALPQDGKPVIQWPHPDMALENVAQGVSKVVTTLLAKLEEEAIRKKKIQDLEQYIDEEAYYNIKLTQHHIDLEYTLKSKQQTQAQLLEQLATLQKEMDQIKTLVTATIANRASSSSYLNTCYKEYHTIAGHEYMGPVYVNLAPKLLPPPFKSRYEESESKTE